MLERSVDVTATSGYLNGHRDEWSTASQRNIPAGRVSVSVARIRHLDLAGVEVLFPAIKLPPLMLMLALTLPPRGTADTTTGAKASLMSTDALSEAAKSSRLLYMV